MSNAPDGFVVVAKDGSGHYSSIQAAVDAIGGDRTGWSGIYVRKGVYQEKLHIVKPRIRLVGENAAQTVISFGDYARKLTPEGKEYGTFKSYTVLIGGDDFQAEELTFANEAGSGTVVGQALAAYVDADRAVFRRCRFLGSQDTLFTGPLPPSPLKGGAFGGPRDALPKRNIRQYYEDCFIAGDVDFIFGSATAVFKGCEIFSLRRQLPPEEKTPVHGYVTAASTPENAAFGYVFHNCRLTGDAPPRSVYLGRPWRGYAKTAFLNCWLGEHIKPEGWHHWVPEREETVCYREYGSTGPGAAAPGQRVGWSGVLPDEEAKRYAAQLVLAGDDGWNPSEGE